MRTDITIMRYYCVLHAQVFGFYCIWYDRFISYCFHITSHVLRGRINFLLDEYVNIFLSYGNWKLIKHLIQQPNCFERHLNLYFNSSYTK